MSPDPPTMNLTLCTVMYLREEHQRNRNLVFAMICAFLCHTLTGAGCKPGLRHVAPPDSCHRCPVEVTLVVCSCSVRPGWCEAAGQSGTVESSFVIISCGFLAFPFLIGISFGFECSSRLIFRRRFQRPPPSPILHRVNRICIIKAKINKSKL